MENAEQSAGTLSWRLSSHPITLLVFLLFRIAPVLVYFFGLWFTNNYVLIFILTILLSSIDFYNLKNIAGRRLVGLRWWNEVNAATGEGTMVFESLDPGDPDVRKINATDKRFFWLALYAQPIAWAAMAIISIVRLHFVWLILVVIALILTVTNTIAFSRCDKFSQASNLTSSVFRSSGFASSLATGLMGRMFSFGRG